MNNFMNIGNIRLIEGRFTQLDVAKNNGGVKFPKMPEGWNPSDDSEDEYTPTRDVAKKRVGDNGENSLGNKLGVKKVKVNHQPVTESSSSHPLVKVKDEKVTDA